MPFKSKAQQRWMFAAESRGEVPKGTARRWAHETKNIKRLPNRKAKRRKPKRRAHGRRAARR
jgi:hypothetical protein